MDRTLRVLDRASEATERHFMAPLRFQYWRSRQTALLRFEDAWTSIESLGLQRAESRRLGVDVQAGRDPVTVADVDQDGFLLSHYGAIARRTCVSVDGYRPRNRYPVSIIATRRGVAVEKHFQDDIRGFVRELRCLIVLREARCRVPAVLGADFDARTIRTAYIPGRVLRDALAECGARLLDRDLPPLAHMDSRALRSWRISEGRRMLQKVLAPATFRAELWHQVSRAHAAGIALSDLKFGNIILDAEDNQPWLIDFELSRCFVRSWNPLFVHLKHKDFRMLSELCDSRADPRGCDGSSASGLVNQVDHRVGAFKLGLSRD
jgi:tRNA A-37 threonylcarbamoyl transferase component Bud32